MGSARGAQHHFLYGSPCPTNNSLPCAWHVTLKEALHHDRHRTHHQLLAVAVNPNGQLWKAGSPMKRC